MDKISIIVPIWNVEKYLVTCIDGIIYQTYQNIEWWSQHISEKTLWIIHLPQPENYTTSLGYVMALIQIAINWTLWILAFIALIFLLYCGFLIFSAGTDDKSASKGKSWIKTAAIALSGIGLSWLIISAMLRFINNIAASGS